MATPHSGVRIDDVAQPPRAVSPGRRRLAPVEMMFVHAQKASARGVSNARPFGEDPNGEFIPLQRALAGEYSLERELGRGGTGVVYLARDVRLDRPVAIKTLPPALAADPGIRERFLHEARTAAKLSHPNIIPIHRVGEAGGFVFFVMAYVDGPTLGARVRREGALPPFEVARIIRDVAWALAHAHARGVIHRDVKPDNILLDRETGRAVMTDFGIAQAAGIALAGDAGMPSIIGTAHFMSPEQAAGRPVDARSDLYSLGIVAWYALAGHLPFEGPPEVVLRKHLTEPVPSLSVANPAVPPALAAAIHQALAKSPDNRFPSAEAFAEAMAMSLAREAQLAAPLRLWLAGRDEMRYVLAAALAVAGLTLAHGGSWEASASFVLAAGLAYVVLDLLEVRRLFALGYRVDDLRSVLRDERARSRQGSPRERAQSRALDAPRWRSLARTLGWIIVGFAVLAIAAIAISHGRFSTEGGGMMIIGLAAVTFGARTPGRNRIAALQARLWMSRVGEILARVVSWRLARDQVELWPAGTAEMLLGRAARDLYASLPVAAQQELPGLPEVMRRLERDAGALRRRIEELGGALAVLESGGVESTGSAVGAHRRAAMAELRAERESVTRQLQAIVSALERLRIDLLQLQAEAGNLSRLTAAAQALDAARRVGTAPQPCGPVSS